MQVFNGIKDGGPAGPSDDDRPTYTTVRRGLTGYRALVMSWDNEAEEYKIAKRDPSVYQSRDGAIKRAVAMATANGWECST